VHQRISLYLGRCVIPKVFLIYLD